MSLISQIKSQCDGRWDLVIESLTGFNGKPNHCPNHGGDSGRAFYGKKKEYAQTGKSFCNTCGCNVDGINTIAFILNVSIKDSIKLIIEYLGGVTSQSVPAMVMNQQAIADKQRLRKRFQIRMNDIIQLIDRSSWISRSDQYFEQRGIKRLANCYYRDIRFVEDVEHFENEQKFTHDAYIFLLRNQEGKVRNVQRLFLNDAHNQKADCDSPKKMMPTPVNNWHRGSAVRLKPKFEQTPGIEHVCEGAETGLSILSQAPIYTNMNCCLTAGNLADYEIAKGTRVLVIWADHDNAKNRQDDIINTGLEKAMILKNRAESEGVQVIINMPTPVGDWLDYPAQCKIAWHQLFEKISLKAA